VSPDKEETSQNQKSAPLVVHGKLPALYITCFGRFEVRRFDASGPSVSLCHNLKGQAILRYLIAHPKRRETVEMLMTKLWSEEAPEAAQHKLRVAISALRRSLNQDVTDEQGGGYILCKDQVYHINPAVVLQSDVDEFLSLYHTGQRASDSTAIDLYERACNLHSGPFLAEDIYEEWSFIRREELTQIYVAMCDRLAELNLESGNYKTASRWASAMLKVDRCDEEAHRQLIRAYAAQKRRSEALRQYQQCQRILAEELGVEPMPETQRLFQMLLKGEDILPTPDRHAL
jgi:DNA-binding SARP family transcriptional activator